MLEAIQRCGYTPEKHKEFLVYGIGDAVARGHMDMAQYLTIQVQAVNPLELVNSFDDASRESLKANIVELFETQRLDLPWLLNTWATIIPSTWMIRCQRECRQLALAHRNWDYLLRLTKINGRQQIKYGEDLTRAIKLGWLDAVEWLRLKTDVKVRHWHIAEAFHAFQQDKPSTGIILEKLLTWSLLELEARHEMLPHMDVFMHEALKLGHDKAMEIIWTTCAHPTSQHMTNVPKMLRDICIVRGKLSPRFVMTTFGQSEKRQLEGECLALALKVQDWTWITWWLDNMNMDANVEIILEATKTLEKRSQQPTTK
ncbi:unnamed protein product [Aphanomyces euteiches]